LVWSSQLDSDVVKRCRKGKKTKENGGEEEKEEEMKVMYRGENGEEK
jgi:hypothetical protein